MVTGQHLIQELATVILFPSDCSINAAYDNIISTITPKTFSIHTGEKTWRTVDER